MDLYKIIKTAYPELSDNSFTNGDIILQDDNDGKGAYIKEWNIKLSIPEDLQNVAKLYTKSR